jgi:Ca2+-binding RTX toxin-like protein
MMRAWARWLRKQWFGFRGNGVTIRRQLCATRLHLEPLEDRLAPALLKSPIAIVPTPVKPGPASVTANPPTVSSFAVSAPSAVVADAGFSVTITAEDQNGNPVTSYSGPVTLTSSDNQPVYVSAGTITLTNGTATVKATLNTADALTLKATSGSLSGVSGNIAVSPAVASFAVSAPSTATAGTGFSVTITALDPFGNVVSGYNGPVTLTSSDGQAINGLPSSLVLSNGTATVTASLNSVNTVTLTASAGPLQGSSSAIVVGPATAATFAVSAPSLVQAGQSFTVTLTARDAFGNTSIGYSGGSVTITSSDGQPVTVAPGALTWTNGSAQVTATLNRSGNTTLKAAAGNVSGTSGSVAVESAASLKVSTALNALMNWGAGLSFPLVGTATAIQNALQVGLLNPINAYLATHAPTDPGFLTVLQQLSAQYNGLTVTVDPTKVVQTINGNDVTISLVFQATQTTSTSLRSLGAQADGLGIRLDPATKVSVTTSLNFNFSFGTSGAAFLLQAPAGGFSVSVSINATSINSAIDIGFLGAQVANGSVQLNAQVSNSAAFNGVGVSPSQNGAMPLATTGSLNVVLPLQAQLGSQSASGTLTISQANLASGSPAVAFQGFGAWQNFSTVGPDAVMGMLNQLSGQLGQLGRQLWTSNLPFLNNLSLAQAVDLGQAFQAEVTSQIASWSATLQRTVTSFTTAQDLANLLAQVLDLTPGQINVQFDPVTSHLTYHLTLSAYTFSDLLPQQIQLNLNQGGLANASLRGSQLSLVPKVTADLTFGIDLTPLGKNAQPLTSNTLLKSLPNGFQANGSTSSDLLITLSDGEEYPISLAGATTINDVMKDIAAQTSNKVQVSIDPSNQEDLLIQQLPLYSGPYQVTTIALNFDPPPGQSTPSLSLTTLLASLNGGAGITTNGPGSNDLQITLTDGSTFFVSLSGARTIQDLINAIQSASQGKVQVGIDPANSTRLLVKQVTPAPGSIQTATFTITAAGNSQAAVGLGIMPVYFTVAKAKQSPAGDDLGILGAALPASYVGASLPAAQMATATLTGHSLSGDSLQNHFFIQNATFTASVDGTVGQVNASANLAAVGLQMTHGTGSLHVQGSLKVPNLTTFQSLTNGLKGATALSSLASAQVSGNAHLDLPLQLTVPLAGYTLPAGAEVAVNWTDITNPSTLAVTVTPALDISRISLQSVMQGLQNLTSSFLQSPKVASLLNQPIPGLGISIGSVVHPATSLQAALSKLSFNPPATIDALVSQLNAQMGQSALSASFANHVLQLNLNYNFAKSQNVTLGFNVTGLGQLADASGSDPMILSASGSIQLGMNIDFSQPANPQFSLQDSSKLQIGAQVSSTGVSFNATVGPLGLYFSGGSVYLDNGTHAPNNPATWTVALNPSAANHLWPLANVAGALNSALKGQLHIDLPTFFPTPAQPLDPTTPDIKLDVADLSKPGSTTTLTLPNFAQALSGINLNGMMNQLVDGWDGLMRLLQSDLTKQLAVQNIPVVGAPLQHALDFLQQINDKVTQQLQNAPQLAATAVQQGLYEALGPGGLNILTKADGSSNPTLQDVALQYLNSNGKPVANASQANGVHYLIHLGDKVDEVLSAGGQVGLPGLGLSFNGNLELTGTFTATLGFGLARDSGFYVDSGDQADLRFGVSLTGNATAHLAFLQLQIKNTSPQILAADLNVNLNINPDQYGRVPIANLGGLSSSNFSYGFGIHPNLQLDAGFNNQPNLPNLTTSLAFTWNTYSSNFNTQAFKNATGIDLTQADGLSFSDVKLNMGSFFDNIAAEIGQVLKPIQPLAEVLSAPLPVLSQLAGHRVDLVDLAAALGVCSPSTADFINAVVQFVGNDPLQALANGFDLGNFTLDPLAALNAAAQGNMTPQSVTLNPTTQGNIATDLKTLPSGFQVPILSNPASAFQLLLGKDVPLFTYTTPALQLSFGFSEFFPVIGPLGVDLQGKIGASAQASFGFDTAGFREFADDDFRDPSLILDGLYVDSRATQLQLYGSIAAYAAVDLGIFSAGVGGGLFASVNFNPHDPSGTGKVHLQDLVADFQKGTIFDVSGSLQAFLNAYVTLNLGIVSHTWTFDIAHVTLATISQNPQVPNTTPQLATLENNVPEGGTQKDVLRLNVGSYAADRLYNSETDASKPSDGNETLTVTQGPTANSVYVTGYGVQNQLNTFPSDNLPHEIIADGLAGSDNITINVTGNIDVDLAAGAGKNTFKVQTSGNVTLTGGSGSGDLLEVDGAANATLTGGTGSETLKVTGKVPTLLNAGNGNNALDASADSAANVILVGGTGNDTLYGGGGSGDLLFADGAAQHNGSWVPVSGYNASKRDLLVAGSGSSQILFGGSGSDVLVGGSGANQQLIPGRGDNTELFGGTGANQIVGANTVLLPGSGSGKNDQYFANSNVDQTLIGSSGDGALLAVGWNLDSSYSETTSGIPVGWQLNSKGQWTPGDNQDGVDIHPNADGTPFYHTYTMYAGSGNNTLMIGGLGNVFLYGSVGTASIYGGGGPGTKMIYAGSGDTNLYGGSPLGGSQFSFTNSAGNLVSLSYASTGMHYLFGGPGRDNLYGGDGIAVGPFMLAGDDNATQGENFLYAGSGLNMLWGDSTTHNELHAGTGNDTLYAGTGGDLLVAGAGIDVLQGGPGNDTFQLPFNPVTGTNVIPDSINGDGGIDTVSFLGSSVNPEIYMTVVQVGTATGTLSGHTITGLTNFAGGIDGLTNLVAGEMVQGPGILPNTTIDSIDLVSGTIYLSNYISTGSSGSLVSTLTFSKYQATLSDLNAQVLTATATPGSNRLTGLSSTAGLIVGESVTGAGVPANTVITGIDSQTSILLSNTAAANPAAPTSTASYTTSLSFPQIGQVQFTVPDSLANVALTGSQTPGTLYGQLNGTTANPSAQIANLASTAMLAVGGSVQLNIPATPNSAASTVNATIASIDSANAITISTPLTYAGTCPVTFPGVQAGTSQIMVDPSVQRNMQLHGGGGSNILMAGSGNDNLYGGPGNNILYGGSGNDLIYGGLRLSGYTVGSTGTTLVISNLDTVNLAVGYLVSGQGIPSGATITSISGTSITVQASTVFNTPAGIINLTVTQSGAQEVLIAGSGSSELAGGNGTEVLIGGSVLRTGSDTNTSGSTTNATTHTEAGPAVLDAHGNYQIASTPAGKDILAAGSGNDLVVAVPNSAGAIIYGGGGSDILVGGGGQDIINGGSGSNTILGGNLFNIINSNSAEGSSTTITGGGGLNFETAGNGNDTLYDYADAATWSGASATASQVYHVNLVPPTPVAQQTQSQLDYVDLIPTINQRNQLEQIAGSPLTGSVAPDDRTVALTNLTNQTILFYQVVPATIAGNQMTLDESNGGNVFVGEMTAGPGIPDGTVITNVDSTLRIFTLSNTCQTSNGQISVQVEIPPMVGMTVSGPGVPASTIIAAIPSLSSIILSNPITPAADGSVSLTLGLNVQQITLLQTLKNWAGSSEITDLKQQGVLEDVLQGGSGTDQLYGSPSDNVWMTGGNLNSQTGTHFFYNYHPGDMISGAGNDTVMFQGIASGTGTINLTYDPSSAQIEVALSTPTQVAEVGQQIALPQTVEVDKNVTGVTQVGLQTLGGNATVSAGLVDASGNLVELPYSILVEDGGTSTNHGSVCMDVSQLDIPFHLVGGLGNDTFKISTTMASGTPNLGSSVSPGVAANELDIQSPAIQSATVNEVNGLLWVNSTPVNQLGGTKSSATTIAFPDVPAFEGLLVAGNSISAPGYLPSGDTIQSVATSNGLITVTLSSAFLSTGPANGALVDATLGLTPRLQTLKIFGSDLVSTPNNTTTNTYSTDGWIPNVIMVGGSGAGAQNTMTSTVSGQTNVTMMGGSGTSVVNKMTVTGGSNTLIGGSGTNIMTANGGINALFGGSGPNTFDLNGPGTYNVIGGSGANVINASGGSGTLMGGPGPNTFTLNGTGTYTAIGGTGPNSFTLTGSGTSTLIGGSSTTNTLIVQTAGGHDTVALSQNGSTITLTDTTNQGAKLTSATATNMTSVTVYASAGGYNTLNASGMTMGVNLIGQALGVNLNQGTSSNNTLIGGYGSDILNGGNDGPSVSENDTLIAGNNSDVLYVSGYNSSYIGKGANKLVYTDASNNYVVVYGKGLYVTSSQSYFNIPAQFPTNSNTSALVIVPGVSSFVPFANVSGISNVLIQGTNGGTPQARLAQNNTTINDTDMPGMKVFTDLGGYDVNGFTTAPPYNNNLEFTVQPGQTITITTSFSALWNNFVQLWDTSPRQCIASWDNYSGFQLQQSSPNFQYNGQNASGWSWTNISGGAHTVFLAGFHYIPVPFFTQSAFDDAMVDGQGTNYITGGWQDQPGHTAPWNNIVATVVFSWWSNVEWTSVNTYAGMNQYGVWSGSLTTSAGNVTSSVPTAPPPSGTMGGSSPASTSAVLTCDQLAASLGHFVNQVPAGSTFADSSMPVIQQLGNLDSLALQSTASLQPSSFAQEVTTFLNNVNAGGLVQSAFVQQQVMNLNAIAASGATTTPATQGLLWFLNNVYFGGLTSAPFAGSSVTSAQATANGTVWFTCANGSLGCSQIGQGAVAITLSGAPVQIASRVVGSEGTAWFATAGGQACYCRSGQSAAVADPLSQLVLSASGNSTAGTAIAVTVTALDAAGNVILDYPGTVKFSSSDPQAGLPANYTYTAADQGSHTFNVVLKTAGTQTITATAGSVSGQASVQVGAASAARFVVSVPATATAGVALSAVTVTVTDAFGNTIAGYTGPVQFSSSDSQAVFSPASYTFTAADQGIHTFSSSVTLKTAGAQTVTATAGGVSGQAFVPVTFAAAASFSVSGPSTATAGTGFKVTITARDAFGNAVTSYSGPVTLTSSDGQSLLNLPSGGIQLSGGVATVPVTLDRANTVQLTAAAGALQGTSGSITVNPAAASQVVFVVHPTNACFVSWMPRIFSLKKA